MNIHRLLKYATSRSLPRPVKLLGLWGLHVLRRRNIGIFIDPVMACNLQCRMCYFSDPAQRGKMRGIISDNRIEQLESALFHRALKLQIGCGAEPTLYNKLPDLIKRGKQSGIPYISLTTNGQRIGNGNIALQELADAGLNELTLSLHGTDPDTYEYLMPGAKFQNLLALLDNIAKVRQSHPNFKLRVNFTVNSMNVGNLTADKFWPLWPDGATPNIIQMRPVQNMGGSAWTDYDLTPLKESYHQTIGAVAAECRRRGIDCIYPSLENLEAVDDSQDSTSSIIEQITYCYVSPSSCYHPDFDIAADTYESYHKRRHTARFLLKSAFSTGKSTNRNASKKLNYRVD